MPTSLLALLDDVASLLRDTSLMTKTAAQKTAGVVGDDLALNANQVSGVPALRELPVVFAVAKGSLRNKVILVPSALLLSALTPWAVLPLLMLGGLFLCYEGVEKVVHHFSPHKPEDTDPLAVENVELVQELTHQVDARTDTIEQHKIKGAIRTDFVLSAEIIVITLGTVAAATLLERAVVLTVVSLLMTVGVYGMVAAIVKIDDLGLLLSRRSQPVIKAIGHGIIAFAPRLMTAITVLGTLAMFIVGGSILAHGIPVLHHWVETAASSAGLVSGLVAALIHTLVGVCAGALVLAGALLVRRFRRPPP